MKRFLVFLCVMTLVFGIIGCKESKSSNSSSNLLASSSGPGTTGAPAEPIDANPTPEPATLLLLGSGLVGLAAFGRKKFFKK